MWDVVLMWDVVVMWDVVLVYAFVGTQPIHEMRPYE